MDTPSAMENLLALADPGRDLHAVWRAVVECESVAALEIEERPTVDQLGACFTQMAVGVEYAVRTYGPAAMPPRFRVFGEHEVEGPFVVCYHFDADTFYASALWLARHAAHFGRDHWLGDYHIPGRRVRVEDRTLLTAVEECYHRYQHVGLGRPNPTVPTGPGHPLEVEASTAWERAIQELGIVTRLLPR